MAINSCLYAAVGSVFYLFERRGCPGDYEIGVYRCLLWYTVVLVLLRAVLAVVSCIVVGLYSNVRWYETTVLLLCFETVFVCGVLVFGAPWCRCDGGLVQVALAPVEKRKGTGRLHLRFHL